MGTHDAFPQKFRFAFLTDMHIHSDSTMKIVDTWLTKIDNVSFFLTGGDNVDIDNLSPATLNQGTERYKTLKKVFDKRGKPYYAAIGNHDRLPHGLRNGTNDFEVFEKTFGQTYYSFVHDGWKFVVLNTVETPNGNYEISAKQIQWLENELAQTPTNQNIAVVSHVPFLSVYYPVLEGKYTSADTFVNQKKVFDLFKDHKLRLVLQGHMHLYEEIKVKDVQFITAGAVSGNWWAGSYHGTIPGYLEVEIDGDTFNWKYKDVK